MSQATRYQEVLAALESVAKEHGDASARRSAAQWIAGLERERDEEKAKAEGRVQQARHKMMGVS